MTDNLLSVALFLFFGVGTVYFYKKGRRAIERTAAANRVKWDAIPLAEQEIIRAANLKQAQKDAQLRRNRDDEWAFRVVMALFCVAAAAAFIFAIWAIREAAVDVIAEGVRRAGR